MLIHEYSWHDAVYLADSSDGCGAANVDGQKAKQIHEEDQKGWLFLFFRCAHTAYCNRTKKPAEPSLAIGHVGEKAESKMCS